MDKAKSKGMSKPVTLETLGEFTEQVILPGVERIVDDKLDGLREEIKSGFGEIRAETRQGFSEVNKSIRVLAGEIMENKEREKEQRHEERIEQLENQVELKPH